MWTTLEPEDRNQKYASVQRQPVITSAVIVIIIITATILFLLNVQVGGWVLSLGAVLQEVKGTKNVGE